MDSRAHVHALAAPGRVQTDQDPLGLDALSGCEHDL